MKKYICNIIILICFTQCIYTQTNINKNEFILDTVHRYEIVNPCLYELLDTLSNTLCNCIFRALNRDYFYSLDIYEDNTIRGQVYAYASDAPFSFIPLAWYRKEKNEKKGFLYYKDRLVLVEFQGTHITQTRIGLFFSKIDSMEIVKYQVVKERLPEVGMGLETSTLHWLYDSNSEKLTVIDRHLCDGQRYYSYEIEEGDTWEKVARKFETTVDKIRTLNGRYDKNDVPIKGTYIQVSYEIVDGVLEVRRVNNMR